MPKNWKYIKKLLEEDFLCEKLKGRITYDLTNYRPATWYQQHFLMKCDDQTLMEASQRWCSVDHRYRKGMPNASRISARIVEKGYDRYDEDSTKLSEDTRYWLGMYIKEEIEMHIAHRGGIYGVEEIIGAIGEYLHNDIEDSLQSGEYFVRALAVVDRRCGKRRLMRYAKQAVSVDDPPWLRRICRTRFEAEGIPYCAAYSEPRS
ncbi:MAG: hypothetical protein J6B02_03860 [Selenomonadales bacterium]|nr:hypothetical protein [Selenomonadales bacterium]